MRVEIKYDLPKRLPLNVEISKLDLRPGDVVLVHVPSSMSVEAAAIAHDVVAAVPGHKVVVVADGIQIEIDRALGADE